jgi:hypothetical protein
METPVVMQVKQDSEAMSTTESLIAERDKLIQDVEFHSITLKRLESRYAVVIQAIQHQCKHVFESDPSAWDSTTRYECTKCKLYL